jgi:hypothetical protein
MGMRTPPQASIGLESAPLAPVIVGEIDDDGIGRAADDDPAEGVVVGRIDFHVGCPCGDVEEVAGADESLRFAVVAPADEGFAFEDVDDGFLLAVVMDGGARTRFDEEGSSPKTGGDAMIAGDGCETERSWGLCGAGVELGGMNGR